METLISPQTFAKATHLEKFDFAVKALMNISKINALNALYAKASHREGVDFIEEIFKELKLNFDFNLLELQRIPKKGPFVCIANHPFGAIDGLLLLYLVRKVRPDFKVMANFLLKEVKPLSDEFIPVNPFGEKLTAQSNLSGMKSAINLLNKGSGLGVFPAGEVSTFQFNQRRITDKKWSGSILKLIQKSEVPIVPVHFSGKNSLVFHMLGLIHPNLRTVALPAEMLKKKPSIKVRIGKPISLKMQKEWKNSEHFGRFLRAKVYAMDSSVKPKKLFSKKLHKRNESEAEIPPPQDLSLIQNEIASIEDLKIVSQSSCDLYLATAERIPLILNEIGRLRELTFREVGEGSNRALDLDQYDLHYEHLFLWDRENKQIVGAYRLGEGKLILNLYGKKGFYINSLFKIKKKFKPYLEQSIELGRSFVVKEYQQKRLPLFLLWKGIVHKLQSKSEYRYLIGPVSISNRYSSLSQLLMVEFIKKYHFDQDLAKYIKPRNKFKVKFKRVENQPLLEMASNDLKKVDALLMDIEPSHIPVPILIKKYIKQNAKIIGFNVDPKFNNSLDGLIMLNINDLPEDSLETYGVGGKG